MAFHWVKFYVKHHTYKFHFIHVVNIFLQGQKEIRASWYFSSFLNFAAHVANLSVSSPWFLLHITNPQPQSLLCTLSSDGWGLLQGRFCEDQVVLQWREKEGSLSSTSPTNPCVFHTQDRTHCQSALISFLVYPELLPQLQKSFLFLKWRWIMQVTADLWSFAFPIATKIFRKKVDVVLFPSVFNFSRGKLCVHLSIYLSIHLSSRG